MPCRRRCCRTADSAEVRRAAREHDAGQIAQQLWAEENPEAEERPEADKIEPSEEHTSLAERRVRLGLLLAELGRKNEVEVTDAEMTQAIMAQARQYPGQERQFFEFIQQNAQALHSLRHGRRARLRLRGCRAHVVLHHT